jgi:hypothetical protein
MFVADAQELGEAIPLQEMYPHLFDGRFEWQWRQEAVGNINEMRKLAKAVSEDPEIAVAHRYPIAAALVSAGTSNRRIFATRLIDETQRVLKLAQPGVPFLDTVIKGRVIGGFLGEDAVEIAENGLLFRLTGKKLLFPPQEEDFPRFRIEEEREYPERVPYVGANGLSVLSSVLQGRSGLKVGVPQIAEALRYPSSPVFMYAHVCLRAAGVELSGPEAERIMIVREFREQAVAGFLSGLTRWLTGDNAEDGSEFAFQNQPVEDIGTLTEVLGLSDEAIYDKLTETAIVALANPRATLKERQGANRLLDQAEQLVKSLAPK